MSAVAETNEQAGPAVASRAEERRALSVACGAHALHDGYTDLLCVMLPLWQAEFGIGSRRSGCYASVFPAPWPDFRFRRPCRRSGSDFPWCWRSAATPRLITGGLV